MVVPALLKWIGNKQRFAEFIVDRFPRRFRNYYEPFLGSGAVLAELNRRKNEGLRGPEFEACYGSDVLPFLVDIFKSVQNEPEKLCKYYAREIGRYNRDPSAYYGIIRDRFNARHGAFDFCLLTRTCYSGVVRFRKKDGYMSTPKGPHKPIGAEAFAARVALWHELVRDVAFETADFADAMARAGAGDVVYCDPPYTHSQRIIYGAQDFDIGALWEAVRGCKERGARVVLSINGYRKSKTRDVAPVPPEGLFARELIVDCGPSMIDRLQQRHKTMDNDVVHDKLLLSW